MEELKKIAEYRDVVNDGCDKGEVEEDIMINEMVDKAIHKKIEEMKGE